MDLIIELKCNDASWSKNVSWNFWILAIIKSQFIKMKCKMQLQQEKCVPHPRDQSTSLNFWAEHEQLESHRFVNHKL